MQWWTILLASHLSYDPIVDMGVRVDDVPDAGIVSSVRGSSVGVARSRLH